MSILLRLMSQKFSAFLWQNVIVMTHMPICLAAWAKA